MEYAKASWLVTRDFMRTWCVVQPTLIVEEMVSTSAARELSSRSTWITGDIVHILCSVVGQLQPLGTNKLVALDKYTVSQFCALEHQN